MPGIKQNEYIIKIKYLKGRESSILSLFKWNQYFKDRVSSDIIG